MKPVPGAHPVTLHVGPNLADPSGAAAPEGDDSSSKEETRRRCSRRRLCRWSCRRDGALRFGFRNASRHKHTRAIRAFEPWIKDEPAIHLIREHGLIEESLRSQGEQALTGDVLHFVGAAGESQGQKFAKPERHLRPGAHVTAYIRRLHPLYGRKFASSVRLRRGRRLLFAKNCRGACREAARKCKTPFVWVSPVACSGCGDPSRKYWDKGAGESPGCPENARKLLAGTVGHLSWRTA